MRVLQAGTALVAWSQVLFAMTNALASDQAITPEKTIDELRQHDPNVYALIEFWGGCPSSKQRSANACDTEGELRSLDDGTQITVTFINDSKISVDLFWIDYEGNREKFTSVPVDGSFTLLTYVSHPWVVVDPDGSCLQVFHPDHELQNLVVH